MGYFLDIWPNIKVFDQNNAIFELLRQKWCRIIMSFRQNTIFGTETCEIGRKVVIWSFPDLPRPVQEDKSLSAKQVFVFIFSDYTFPFLLANLSCFFVKSCVLLSEFIIFYEIIGFIKQIYDFFIKSYILLNKFMVFF